MASGARNPPASPNQRLRPIRARVRRISDWNSTITASPMYGTMNESSERSASSPAHDASAYSETMIRMPIRMWPARVPRTTISAWYTRNATTRISITPVSFSCGSDGNVSEKWGIGESQCGENRPVSILAQLHAAEYPKV